MAVVADAPRDAGRLSGAEIVVTIDGPLLERVKAFHANSFEWRDRTIESFCAWLVRRGLSEEIGGRKFFDSLRPGGRECS